jgi:hypothetical protein
VAFGNFRNAAARHALQESPFAHLSIAVNI